MKFLLFGGNGWIGSQVNIIIKNMKHESILATSRCSNYNDMYNEITLIKPDRIICLIGRTSGKGFNSIDYLEQKGKLVENIHDNLYGPITLANICNSLNIHLTYLGTGCIFNGYPQNGYTESNEPDFFGSSYSVVKGFTDRLIKQYQALNVRIRMPIVDSKHPKDFITKIINYKNICNMENSMTVLPDLLPIMIDLAINKHVGTINLVNPGTISHNTILNMVKQLQAPNLEWNNITIDEQNNLLMSERSNNKLSTDKLLELYPNVPNIYDSILNILAHNKKI